MTTTMQAANTGNRLGACVVGRRRVLKKRLPARQTPRRTAHFRTHTRNPKNLWGGSLHGKFPEKPGDKPRKWRSLSTLRSKSARDTFSVPFPALFSANLPSISYLQTPHVCHTGWLPVLLFAARGRDFCCAKRRFFRARGER